MPVLPYCPASFPFIINTWLTDLLQNACRPCPAGGLGMQQLGSSEVGAPQWPPVALRRAVFVYAPCAANHAVFRQLAGRCRLLTASSVSQGRCSRRPGRQQRRRSQKPVTSQMGEDGFQAADMAPGRSVRRIRETIKLPLLRIGFIIYLFQFSVRVNSLAFPGS